MACEGYDIAFVSTDGQTKSDLLNKYFEIWKQTHIVDYRINKQLQDSNFEFVHIRDALHLCKNLRNIIYDGGGIKENEITCTLADLRPYLQKLIVDNQNLFSEEISKSHKIIFKVGNAEIDMQDLNPIDKQSCNEVKSILSVGYEIFLKEKDNIQIDKKTIMVI